MNELTKFEKEAMSMLLCGDDDVLENLREQFKICKVKNKENTGHGFFIDFELPPDWFKVSIAKSFNFGDVGANLPELCHGAGFVLFVKDGCLDILEAFSYDGPWPESIIDFELSYVINGEFVTNGERDLETLRLKWQ